jgi:hypothetical protein
MVLNPYMLLGLVPAEAKFFTCLDLKDAFFGISLAPQSQPIFAFQCENPNTGEKGQLTWIGCLKISKTPPLPLELPWYLTSKLSQPTSTAAHSFSTWMTPCWLDQLKRTVWKGLFSLFYGRQDTKFPGRRPTFAKTLSIPQLSPEGSTLRGNQLSVPFQPPRPAGKSEFFGSHRFLPNLDP